MAKQRAKQTPPAQRRTQRIMLGLVLASSIASAAAIVWFRGDHAGPQHGRVLDPEHLSGDVEDMAEVAESFVTFWSTFRYEEATHVSSGDSLARVRLAIDKEGTLSGAERQLARELRKSVEGLEVQLLPREVVDDDETHKLLRATAIVKASDRTVRREQEFRMVRVDGQWKVSSWDPGEPEGEDGSAEPGLQIPEQLEGIDEPEPEGAP